MNEGQESKLHHEHSIKQDKRRKHVLVVFLCPRLSHLSNPKCIHTKWPKSQPYHFTFSVLNKRDCSHREAALTPHFSRNVENRRAIEAKASKCNTYATSALTRFFASKMYFHYHASLHYLLLKQNKNKHMISTSAYSGMWPKWEKYNDFLTIFNLSWMHLVNKNKNMKPVLPYRIIRQKDLANNLSCPPAQLVAHNGNAWNAIWLVLPIMAVHDQQ